MMDTKKFIREVQNRPVLYNKEYRYNDCAQKCWQEVADMFQIDVETAKHKWKGLRDTFRIEIKKTYSKTEKKNGFDDCYTSSWNYYNDLLFLKDVMKIKKPISEHIFFNDLYSNVKLEKYEVYLETPNWNGTEIPQNETTQKTDDDLDNSKSVDVKEDTKPIFQIDENDDDWLFFKSLIPYVKKLPEKKKLCFRIEVQEIINTHLFK